MPPPVITRRGRPVASSGTAATGLMSDDEFMTTG